MPMTLPKYCCLKASKSPIPCQVLIRNTVIGLNFVEVYYRLGTFPPLHFQPFVVNEAAVVMVAVGADDTSVETGDRVVYSDDVHGAYSRLCRYPADHVVIIPDGLWDMQAASSRL